MIPLRTMDTRPSVSEWGCAFSHVTLPWVAHLVCPIPVVGSAMAVAVLPLPLPLREWTRCSVRAASASLSEERLPTARTDSMRPSSWKAKPAES